MRREPLSEYLANRNYVSSSQLRRFARYGRPRAEDPRAFDGSIMGQALHAFVLDPAAFEAQYLVLDGSVPARPCPGEREAKQKERLDAWQWTALVKTREAILSCTQAPVADWLARGEKELSIYWSDESGHGWKARPDSFTEDIVLELKTTSDCRPEPFARTRVQLWYDLQAAHYVDAVSRLAGKRPRFAYVAVELASPHAVRVHELRDVELESAMARLQHVKREFAGTVTQSARA